MVSRSLATIAFFLIMVFIVCIMRIAAKREQKEEPEIIWVPESPQPTKTVPTPKTTPLRRRLERLQPPTRRAGKMRLKGHRRAHTHVLDPTWQDHCGYVCVLRAAHMRVCKQSIEKLRRQTSLAVTQGFLNDEWCAGLSVRKVVMNTHMTLAQYAAQVSHRLWASQVELHYDAKSLNVTVACNDGKNTYLLGEEGNKVKYLIAYQAEHYTLRRVHKKVRLTKGAKRHVKGGMQPGRDRIVQDMHDPDVVRVTDDTRQPQVPPTWEELHEAGPTQVFVNLTCEPLEDEGLPPRMAPPMTVNLRGVDVPLRRAAFLFDFPVQISELRTWLATCIRGQRQHLTLRDSRQGIALPDWVHAPTHVEVTEHITPMEEFDVTFVDTEAEIPFTLRIHIRDSHRDLLGRLGRLLRTPQEQIVLSDSRGEPWILPDALHRDRRATIVILRGGMRRATPSSRASRSRTTSPRERTVSSTQPYMQEEQDDNIQDMNHVEITGTSSSGSPTTPRTAEELETTRRLVARVTRAAESYRRRTFAESEDRSYTTFTAEDMRRVSHMGREILISRVLPTNIPSAQQNEGRPVFVLDVMIGFVNAAIGALVNEVLDDILQQIPVVGQVSYQPETAHLWQEVTGFISHRHCILHVTYPMI